jgi:hypothetical protein
MRTWVCTIAGWLIAAACACAAEPPLQMSVFAVADDVLKYLTTPGGRDQAAAVLRDLHITGIFLEGRRGDTHVPPETMRPIRDYFLAKGFRVSGGIATVPGRQFAVREDGKLGWINYQDPKSQRDLAGFFRENASVFDEIVIDDFYCSDDRSPMSEKARRSRSWGEYRRDLLTGLLQPMVFQPARAVRPGVRLIIKYPQWYDRFHLFGYDPARMSEPFDRVWVGTEVRNPQTRRMGFVQPTEGYMNFRWIASVAGDKVFGAWFDHIECTPQNFLDQAYQSVLAGARELTLFHLGDVMEGHPGHALLKRDWDALGALKERVRARPLGGIPFYKPVNSDSDENVFLMDYLGMIGLPVVPASQYPAEAKVAILGVQAAGDPELAAKMKRHLAHGAKLIVTPALARKLGKLPGVEVWNVRTFSEDDYTRAGERLLAPTKVAWLEMPRAQLDALRNRFLAPLGVKLSAPAGVAYYMFGDAHCFYNFLDHPVEVVLNGQKVPIAANALVWR